MTETPAQKEEMPTPQSGGLQAYRSVEILERIGTPTARAVLEILAKGHDNAFLTIEAKEALKRLP